jgi:hypothetical protein
MGVFLWKLRLIKNAIAVDSSFPRFGMNFASKCVCCSSPCIERVDHLSQSDIARIIGSHFSPSLNVDFFYKAPLFTIFWLPGLMVPNQNHSVAFLGSC